MEKVYEDKDGDKKMEQHTFNHEHQITIFFISHHVYINVSGSVADLANINSQGTQ
jgi:hypothetical protein